MRLEAARLHRNDGLDRPASCSAPASWPQSIAPERTAAPIQLAAGARRVERATRPTRAQLRSRWTELTSFSCSIRPSTRASWLTEATSSVARTTAV